MSFSICSHWRNLVMCWVQFISLFLPTIEYNFYSICTKFHCLHPTHRNCDVFILLFLSRLRSISFRGYRNRRMRNQCYSFTLQRFPFTDRPQHEKETQRKHKKKTRWYRMCKRIVCKKKKVMYSGVKRMQFPIRCRRRRCLVRKHVLTSIYVILHIQIHSIRADMLQACDDYFSFILSLYHLFFFSLSLGGRQYMLVWVYSILINAVRL